MEHTSQGRPVLVTGGAGFIGSHLVRSLAMSGRDIHVLVRPHTDRSRIASLGDRLTFHDTPLLDRTGMNRLLADVNPVDIIHLAASNIMSGRTAGAHELIATNLEGTVNLLDASTPIPYRSFILAGTFLEYGEPHGAAQEDAVCEPRELYAITKLAATNYARSVARANKKPIVIFRFFTPYGPSIQPGRLIYELVTRALRHEELFVTDPLIARDFIYIDDLVSLISEGMALAERFPGEIFNAGTGTPTTLQALVEIVREVTKSRSAVRWGSLPTVAYDGPQWQADMQKTFSHFSWKPSVSLQEGVAKTAQWFTMAGH